MFTPQKVWRNLSEPKATGCGYFVWEVLEVVGAMKPQTYFTICRDGSYLYVQCFHIFTQSRADEFMNSVESYQELILI